MFAKLAAEGTLFFCPLFEVFCLKGVKFLNCKMFTELYTSCQTVCICLPEEHKMEAKLENTKVLAWSLFYWAKKKDITLYMHLKNWASSVHMVCGASLQQDYMISAHDSRGWLTNDHSHSKGHLQFFSSGIPTSLCCLPLQVWLGGEEWVSAALRRVT